MSVIGVDLGNDTCVIGIAARGGIDIILNENSNRKNPCLVSFQAKERLMGEAALSIARSNFKNTVREVKRLVGRKWSEPDLQVDCARLPYKTMEHPESGGVAIKVMYDDEEKIFTPEQIIAMMLTKLVAIAKAANANIDVADTVLAIPGWYTDSMRQAMLDACTVGGVNCLRLMHEHTATALAYGIYKSAKGLFHATEPEHVLFLDLGHSSFSACVVKFIQGSLSVKSAAFDRSLGGRDMDWAIVVKCANDFKAKTGKDVFSQPKALLKLMDAAEKAKKILSPIGVKDSAVNIECLYDELDYIGRLERGEFEDLIRPLVERMKAPVTQALEEAGVTKEQLSAVEIVGGATRVPLVKDFLATLLGRDKSAINFGLSCTLNADESVARGCALQCAMLSSRFKVKEFSIVEAVPYPIQLGWENDDGVQAVEGDEEGEEGLSTDGGTACVFRKNDETPKVRRVNLIKKSPFTITARYDKSAVLPTGADTAIGTFKVDVPKGDDPVKVRVNVKHDIHGIFTVSSAEMMKEVKEAKEEPPAAKATEDGGVAPMEVDGDTKEGTKGEQGNGKGPAENEAGQSRERKEGKAAAGSSTDKSVSKENPTEPALKKKKPVFSKVALKVDQQTAAWSKEKIDAAVLEEAQMANQDRILKETADKRNELESYIYGMRDRLVDLLQSYVEPEEAEDFKAKLTDAEDWLYSDEGFDSSKSVYAGKLAELTALGLPIESRLYEANNRQSCVTDIQGAVEVYTKFVNSTDEAYAHIEDEERAKMRAACSSAEKWLFDKLEQQASLPASKNPAVTCEEIKAHAKDLHAICRPIMKKPKPKPVVKADPPATPAQGENESKPSTAQGGSPAGTSAGGESEVTPEENKDTTDAPSWSGADGKEADGGKGPVAPVAEPGSNGDTTTATPMETEEEHQ